MKKALLTLLVIAAGSAAPLADTIALWDFNFPATGTVPPSGDANMNTGTFEPFIGSGSLTNIGGTTNSFGSTQGNGNSDPWVADNSALRLGQFPSASTANKTAGVQFFVSTVGYENIQVKFDQENSNTASRYWRVQYTTDGLNWVDHVVFVSAGSTAWVNERLVDFSAVPGVKDNPNFGVRYVSEWEATATGSGLSAYVANLTSSSYSANGTLWLDMVTVSGSILNTNNTEPTITAIPDQSIRANQSLGPLAFTIGDAETAATLLTVTAESSNPALIQNFTFGGSGSNRTISLTPEPNQSGLAMITVTVTDEGGKATASTFDVLVRNPAIIISNQTLRANTSRVVNFHMTDIDSFLGTMALSAISTNETLLPSAGIIFGGTGTNRTLSLTPAASQTGVSLVTVTASDGSLSVNATFFFKVVDTNTIVLWDFNSKIRDTQSNTGDLSPSIGSGTASSVGTATNSLNSNVAGVSADPDQGDNTKWRLANFPEQGSDNKTSGAEFRLSTEGYQDISVSWEHYNSATGSRYWRLQYSVDGVNFTDHTVYTNPVVTTFLPTGASFGGIPGVNNNPNFAVRIVTEFESTATGGDISNDEYVGTQASGAYGSNGTLWLDTVRFTGNPFVEPVELRAALSGKNVLISWSANLGGYTLQSRPSLSSGSWAPFPQAPTVVDGQNVVTITNATDSQLFRLVK